MFKVAQQINSFKPPKFNLVIFSLLLIFIGSCSTLPNFEKLYGPDAPKNRILSSKSMKENKYISYSHEVQPILNQRCAVCHSCNDAPCQLNFTSIEGVDRGLSKFPVYNGSRLLSQEPTRLGIDASSAKQWREKDFSPILNERRSNIQVNLDNSLLYKVLTAKRSHEFITKNGQLPAKYGIGEELINDESFVHSQTCPDIEQYSEFALDNPQWGMPFVLPALSNKEFKTIETWLEQGAYAEPDKPLSKKLKKQVNKWEAFLNGKSNKEQLMSRYIYEHLFVGHIYFEGISDRQFFMLQRSKTPPGQAIELITTIRPYNNPGVDKVYYRLKRYDRTVVDKTHMPYAFSDKRMVRYKELFLKPSYTVAELPSYNEQLAANPFKTFKAIPPNKRYQFLLDDAKFFISGFIKGPVCRGSIALSVIDDHFWVVFLDPRKNVNNQDSEFLARESSDLGLPIEDGDNASVLSVWLTYEKKNSQYLMAKLNYFKKNIREDKGFGLNEIWDGDGENDNAALTIYRHYDSATVLNGFVGEVPKTGWIIDFPLFERIYYLLVAGYNVYGKVGHQLSTRIYMDFLRREGEYNFLLFLPKNKRFEVYKSWYQGTGDLNHLKKTLKDLKIKHESNIVYKTTDVKKEFYQKLADYLNKAKTFQLDMINRCDDFPIECHKFDLSNQAKKVHNALTELSSISGFITNVFPNVTFMRVKVDGSVKNDLVYTIIRNKFYLNNASLLSTDKLRVMDKDTLDIIPGFVGSYPNFFIEINFNDIEKFVAEYKEIKNKSTYELLINKYGIRRSNPDFWKLSDWFYKKYQYDSPVNASLFDLNRYKNR